MQITVGMNILAPRGEVAPHTRESIPQVAHTTTPLGTLHVHTCHWCGKPWDCREAGCNLPVVLTRIKCPNRPGFPATLPEGTNPEPTKFASDAVANVARTTQRVWDKARIEAQVADMPEHLRDLAREFRKTR